MKVKSFFQVLCAQVIIIIFALSRFCVMYLISAYCVIVIAKVYSVQCAIYSSKLQSEFGTGAWCLIFGPLLDLYEMHVGFFVSLPRFGFCF